MRQKVMVPTNGSSMILNARIDSGSVSDGLAHDLVALEVDALDRRHVERRRQKIDHGVEQRLHALVLEGGAAQHREERARGSSPCG